MALGQHLRADQQPHLAAVHALERRLERAALAHGIAIDARQRECPGRRRASVSSMRSVPWPTGFTASPQSGQISGMR